MPHFELPLCDVMSVLELVSYIMDSNNDDIATNGEESNDSDRHLLIIRHYLGKQLTIL